MNYAASSSPSVNAKALLWTAGAHLAVLLLFLLIRFQIAVPGSLESAPAPELGMEVNLGSGPFGSGDDQPMDVNDPSSNRGGASAAGQSADRQYADNNDPDAEDLPSSTNSRPTTSASTTTATSNSRSTSTSRPTSQPAQSPRYSYDGNGNGGNRANENRNGSGEGPNNGAGDAGVNGGTTGAPNYTGVPGSGGGIRHNLNRSLAQNYRLSGAFRNGGQVVARITVNREGAIINTTIVKAPNSELRRLALEKLRIIRYTAAPSAPPEQVGTIYLDFVGSGGR